MRIPQQIRDGKQGSPEIAQKNKEHLATELAKKEVKKLAENENLEKIENDTIAQAFIAAGGNAWVTENYARVYIDVTKMPKYIDLSDCNKTTLYKMSNAKVYWDVLKQDYDFEAIYERDAVEAGLIKFISDTKNLTQ